MTLIQMNLKVNINILNHPAICPQLTHVTNGQPISYSIDARPCTFQVSVKTENNNDEDNDHNNSANNHIITAASATN